MTLHTVNRSPFQQNTLAECLNVCGANDALLLIEDGVYGALEGAATTASLKHKVKSGLTCYALKDDVVARGLDSKLLPAIQLIDMDGFVQLTTEHNPVQSWF